MTPAPSATTKQQGDTPLPFSDVTAEAYLLAASMWSPDAYTAAARLVNAAAFYRPAHASIWTAISWLHNHDRTGDPVADIVAVSDRLRQTQDHVDTIRLVERIFDLPWTRAGVTYNARLVARAAVRRHVSSCAVRTAQASTVSDHDGFRDELTRSIDRLTSLAAAWDAAS